MQANEYQEAVKRTAPSGETRTPMQQISNSIVGQDLIHAALGISSESGEFSDAVKKAYAYGRHFDFENAKEELGDLMWYISLAASTIGVSLEEVMERNIDKLKVRYPEKFTEKDALERKDKEHEQ